MVLLVVAGAIATACSTQKNTAKSRWWHSFNAKYNTYYNGSLAYIDGSLEKEKGNRDNFTEIIPLYTVGNKNSRQIGKGNFDRAIEKSQKAIKQHSIKKRPEFTKSRRKTAKDIEWLSRREYNPFLWKAWMLMGRSQFHQGAFEDAASTFAYMSRLYQTQPAIYGKARAWLAKAYIEQGWMYDAEDVIRNMQRDSLDWRAVKEWDYTYADYYIHTGEYEKAIPYLRKVIKHEMRRKQKAREWFLMGQLEAALGNRQLAYKAFKRVIRQNPPYELEFNARIAMTEVMSANNAKQMIGRLKRMAANDNNKDYLDQIYYAIGNIYLNQRDTANAIAAYEKGNEKATRSGIEKGVLLLRLGNLYWEKEKFSDARRCYGEAIGLLDKERKDYKQLSERSKVLDELTPYTEAVHLQDSLQDLAKMSEKDRNAAIDRVIEALKKKEKEEKRAQLEAEAMQQQGQNSGKDPLVESKTSQTTSQTDRLWYFYNQMAVNQGKTTFQRQWGKRENVDDWQRVNKTIVGGFGGQGELTDEQRDSIAQAEAVQDSLSLIADSAHNNPHKREYYLAQIPFTEEQVQASNLIIMDGLHHAGVIFKDKLDNLPLSEKHLRRVTDQYPEYEHMDDVYYHLFLLYSRLGDTYTANSYLDKLKEKHPDSQWTKLLTDPYFKENALFGTHIEDSLYAATYEAFRANRYSEVASNARLSETRFSMGANRDKFVFISGLSKLNNGDADGCMANMEDVVKNYPKSRISEMAGMIINGVKAGRRLHGGNFDLGDVWNRRSVVLKDSDSTAVRTFVPDRDVNFNFILAYHPDSINENQLLYELAKFNFTNYMVRNFDISIEDVDGVARMTITGFRNFDEVHLYAQQLYAQPALVKQMAKTRGIIISEKNLPLLGTNFSYKEYEVFYKKHFAPLKVKNLYLLTEPAEIAREKEPDLPEEPEKQEKENLEPADNNQFVVPLEVENEPTDNGTTLEPTDEPATAEPNENAGVSPDAPAQPEPATPVEEKITPAEKPTTPVENETVPIEEDTVPVKEETVPVENEVTPVQDDNSVTIEDVPVAEEPVDNNTFIIDEEVPAAPDNTITVPEEKPAEQQKEPVSKPQNTPVTELQDVPADEPANENDEPTFYFEDEYYPAPEEPANTPNAPADQPQAEEYDLEDEYYELDGF